MFESISGRCRKNDNNKWNGKTLSKISISRSADVNDKINSKCLQIDWKHKSVVYIEHKMLCAINRISSINSCAHLISCCAFKWLIEMNTNWTITTTNTLNQNCLYIGYGMQETRNKLVDKIQSMIWSTCDIYKTHNTIS